MKNIFTSLNKKLIILFLYFTLLISFFLNENSSGGSEKDYFYTYKYVLAISKDIIYGLKLTATEHPQHFPLNYLLQGTLLKIFKEAYIVKLFFLHISIIIPIIFYKCINLVHQNKEASFIFSLILFISPYFRSSAVWATTDNLAILFFLLTIFFYLKFEFYKKKICYIYLSIFFLFLSFYTRQYYILFSLYFFFKLYKNKLLIKNLHIILLLILLLSTPSGIYIYYYYIPRISELTLYYSKNFINNFYIVFSIFIFYLFPFLIFLKKNITLFFKFFKKNFFYNLLIITISFFLSYYFDYNLNIHGGGIIFKFFNLFLNLKLFFLFTSFSIILIIFFFKENVVNNINLLLIIFFSFYFQTIFQKYFDPILMILFLTLFKSKLINNTISNIKNNYFYLYIYFLIFYLISVIYNH